jgi:hypothetical protein
MTKADIEALPAREFDDYVLYIQLITRQENEQQRRVGGNGH